MIIPLRCIFCDDMHAKSRIYIRQIVGDDAHIVPQIQLSQYGNVIEKYINGITGVEKYVIMPNHVHLIIMINDGNNGTMETGR